MDGDRFGYNWLVGMTRDELYQRFGPMLIEAIVLVIKDEINILHDKAGLSERTNQQIINSVSNKLNTLEKYNWMREEK